MYYHDWKVEEALRSVLLDYFKSETVEELIAEIMSELKYR